MMRSAHPGAAECTATWLLRERPPSTTTRVEWTELIANETARFLAQGGQIKRGTPPQFVNEPWPQDPEPIQVRTVTVLELRAVRHLRRQLIGNPGLLSVLSEVAGSNLGRLASILPHPPARNRSHRMRSERPERLRAAPLVLPKATPKCAVVQFPTTRRGRGRPAGVTEREDSLVRQIACSMYPEISGRERARRLAAWLQQYQAGRDWAEDREAGACAYAGTARQAAWAILVSRGGSLSERQIRRILAAA